jgi:hypothetical protein
MLIACAHRLQLAGVLTSCTLKLKWRPMHAGEYAAINLSEKGSGWKSTKVLKIPAEGPPGELPDHLKYVKFSSPSWTADSLGFFYSRFVLLEISAEVLRGK